MGLKDFIRKNMDKKSEKAKKLKAIEEDLRLQKIAQDRMKSPMEREMEDFIERKRQEQLKKQVMSMRKKENEQMFRSNLMDKKNIFKGHRPIMTSGGSYFK